MGHMPAGPHARYAAQLPRGVGPRDGRRRSGPCKGATGLLAARGG